MPRQVTLGALVNGDSLSVGRLGDVPDVSSQGIFLS
jgi:hypothetical protein